jgi:hypothetical protein
MADDLLTLAGLVKTDELPSGAHVQQIKILGGTADANEPIPGTTLAGLLVQVSAILSSVAVTGPFLTDTQLRAIPLSILQQKASSANVTTVGSTASAGGVQILALNANRLGLIVANESTASLYLKYGTVPSLTSYTVKIPPGYYWEMLGMLYTGAVWGIWDAQNGNARVTELVP